MDLDRYEFRIGKRYLVYEFFSHGPNGIIKKVVKFTFLFGTNTCNLGFGDFNESTGEISDTVVTNNRDSKKILATVAAIIHDFTIKFPKAMIIVQGSTDSRTRLYRIGITNHWIAIQMEFAVYGWGENGWELFQFERNYDAFLVHRK